MDELDLSLEVRMRISKLVPDYAIPQISFSQHPSELNLNTFPHFPLSLTSLHLPTLTNALSTPVVPASSLLSRQLLVLMEQVKHNQSDSNHDYEDIIKRIIAGENQIETLKTLIVNDFRLFHKSLNLPVLNDETPLIPRPVQRNSGNFFSL